MTRCVNPACCSERSSHGSEGHECVPRDVRDMAYLCHPCRSRMARLLSELPSLYADLGESLTTARRRGPGRGRSHGLNLEDIVVRARGRVAAFLAGWVRVVAEERGLVLPLSDAVDTLAHWLGRHVDWLAHQPFADEALTQLTETHGDARRARQIAPPRRFPLKTPAGDPIGCDRRAEGPVAVGGHWPRCQGSIEAVVRDDTPLLPSNLVCSGNPEHTWAPHEWPGLGRRVNPLLDSQAMRLLAIAIVA